MVGREVEEPARATVQFLANKTKRRGLFPVI
jgi:hypothetical protein